MNRFLTFLIIAFFPLYKSSVGQSTFQSQVGQESFKDSVEKYQKLKQYGKVLSFTELWAGKLKAGKMETSSEYGAALNAMGDALIRSGKYKEAETHLLLALEIRKKNLGDQNPEVAATLNNLGKLYWKTGDFKKAETFYLQALEMRKKSLGEAHPDVAGSLNNLGILYADMGNFTKAEPFYLQALEIKKKAMGENHPDVASALNNLGLFYRQMGDFFKAVAYSLQALDIRKDALGENHLEVAISQNNLGVVYSDMGNYPKAEPYYLKSLEIKKKNLGENHPDVANSLNNLGIFYKEIGNFLKAEPYHLKALEIRKKIYGENHPDVATSLNNLGSLYWEMRKYQKAEPLQLRSLEMQKKNLGENHPDVAGLFGNLGILYKDMGSLQKAEQFHIQALNIRKNAFGENHPEVAVSLGCLADLFSYKGNYSKAEPLIIKALEINKNGLGGNHPNVSASIGSLGLLNFKQARLEKAEVWFLDWNAKKQVQIQRYFPFLSDHEKARFYDSNLSGIHDVFKTFCVERYFQKKAITADLYNDQLATKGLLLISSAKWKHRIRTSGDKKLFNIYNNWEASQNVLNKLIQSTDSAERAGIDSIQAKTEQMEKELSLRSENFARLADKKIINWKEVQKALKPGEAAVEMIRVLKFGISKTIIDSIDPAKPKYKIKGLTDTVYYAALIVKPESVYPEMVLLKNGNDLEGKYLNFYQNALKKQFLDNRSYHHFWEKIGNKLNTSSKVYFSPDGVYHNLNLNTLFNPKAKKYLLDEKDIRVVSITKDIVNPIPSDEDNKLAELVGFPNYYEPNVNKTASTSERISPELKYGLRLESFGALSELPGTRTEVEKIASILEGANWEVKNYTGSNALEENIKEAFKPRLLHIATHGFFQPDVTDGMNPLLRSGLMLTGAGNTLKGQKNESGEDGILTAYEAMNLNLDNTDLVVLSACETGLGEIKNGEGVYGLQRAFKVAGAKSIIMSLWRVDDEATQELMVLFYKNWLASTPAPLQGREVTKRSAFLKAQKEIKAKYPNPYFWGAFVMVGD